MIERHRTRISITFQLGWRNAIVEMCVNAVWIVCSHVAIGMVMSINHIIMKIIFNLFFIGFSLLYFKVGLVVPIGIMTSNLHARTVYSSRMHVITTASTSHNSVLNLFSSFHFTSRSFALFALWSSSIYCFDLLYFTFSCCSLSSVAHFLLFYCSISKWFSSDICCSGRWIEKFLSCIHCYRLDHFVSPVIWINHNKKRNNHVTTIKVSLLFHRFLVFIDRFM